MIFLKFPDEKTFNEKAAESGLTYENQDGIVTILSATNDITMDIIGNITIPGKYEIDLETSELVELEPPVVIEGYHINIVGVVPESFLPYMIPSPKTPHRVFA